jgi:hypothetical protein
MLEGVAYSTAEEVLVTEATRYGWVTRMRGRLAPCSQTWMEF